MENYSREIIDLICDSFKDNKDLVMNMLYYVYYTTTDSKMKNQIEDIFDDEHYCLKCCCELKERTYTEVHDELEERPVEYIKEWYCPTCEKYF